VGHEFRIWLFAMFHEHEHANMDIPCHDTLTFSNFHRLHSKYKFLVTCQIRVSDLCPTCLRHDMTFTIGVSILLNVMKFFGASNSPPLYWQAKKESISSLRLRHEAVTFMRSRHVSHSIPQTTSLFVRVHPTNDWWGTQSWAFQASCLPLTNPPNNFF